MDESSWELKMSWRKLKLTSSTRTVVVCFGVKTCTRIIGRSRWVKININGCPSWRNMNRYPSLKNMDGWRNKKTIIIIRKRYLYRMGSSKVGRVWLLKLHLKNGKIYLSNHFYDTRLGNEKVHNSFCLCHHIVGWQAFTSINYSNSIQSTFMLVLDDLMDGSYNLWYVHAQQFPLDSRVGWLLRRKMAMDYPLTIWNGRLIK